MKKILIGFTICAILIVSVAATDIYERLITVEKPRTGDGNSVKNFAASGGDVVYAGECILKGTTFRSTTAAGKIILYDNATAGSGTAVMNYGRATDEDGGFVASNIHCANGIYATITTGDATIEYFPLLN